MQTKLRTYLLAIAAATMTVACGGGGGSDSSANNTGNGGSVSPEAGSESFAACFTLPDTGKSAAVTATSTVPLEVHIATLTGLGSQTFEGQSYPALDVRNRIDQVLGSDQHHALYMLSSAPFLPAGAVTHPSTGDTDPAQRYVYTYTRMTLEQLRDTAMSNPGMFRGNAVLYPNLRAVVPALADFQLNTPVTLLKFERQAGGTNPLPAAYKGPYLNELTITYAGREDVTVGSTVYSKVCKMNVDLRRSGWSEDGMTPFSISRPVSGSAWFAPGVGLVKASVPVFGNTGSISATVSPAQ